MKTDLPPNRPTGLLLVAALVLLRNCPTAEGAEYRDDFSAGATAWQAGPAWSVQGSGPTATFTVDTTGDEFAWNQNIALRGSWVIETEFELVNLYNDGNWTGTAGIALANSANQLLYLADVIYSQDAYLYPGMGYYDGQWHNSLEPNAWHPNAQSTVTLRLERPPGADRLNFTVTCPNGFKQEYTSLPIPALLLDQVTRLGLRGFKGRIAFSHVAVTTPLPLLLEIAAYPGLTLRGSPGTVYEIQQATAVDATEWTALTNVTLEAGVQIWIDLSPPPHGIRFYRAVEQ